MSTIIIGYFIRIVDMIVDIVRYGIKELYSHICLNSGHNSGHWPVWVINDSGHWTFPL
jgi:hypothetical protein